MVNRRDCIQWSPGLISLALRYGTMSRMSAEASGRDCSLHGPKEAEGRGTERGWWQDQAFQGSPLVTYFLQVGLASCFPPPSNDAVMWPPQRAHPLLNSKLSWSHHFPKPWLWTLLCWEPSLPYLCLLAGLFLSQPNNSWGGRLL